MKNYYDILGLNTLATKEEIKKAYRKLSIKFHPDKNDGEPFFTEMFKQINDAHEILLDDAKKQKYDGRLQDYLSGQDKSKFINELHVMEEKLRKDREAHLVNLREQEQRLKNKEAQLTQLREQELRSKVKVHSPAQPLVKPVIKRNYNHIWDKVRKWKTTRKIAFWVNICLFIYLIAMPQKKHASLKADFIGANGRVLAKSGVNIRELPNKESKVIIAIPYGKFIKVVGSGDSIEKLDGKQNRWYRVVYSQTNWYHLNNPDIEGWVWGGMVEDL